MKIKLLVALSYASVSLAFAAGGQNDFSDPHYRDSPDRDDARREFPGSLVKDSAGRVVGEHLFISYGLLAGGGELVRVRHRNLTFTIPVSASGFSQNPAPDNAGLRFNIFPEVVFESSDCSGPAFVPQSPLGVVQRAPGTAVTFLVGPLATQVGDVIYVPGEFVESPLLVGSALSSSVSSGPTPVCFAVDSNFARAPYYKATTINFSELGFKLPFRLE